MASRVGGDLRAARERLGWSLPDTSAYIRIRLPLLQALEDGRVADLPGPVYVLGFVRTYAQALGIDPDEMVRRYHEETGAPPPRAKLDFPAPLPQRHVPAGTVVMLGLLLAVGGYVGWYRASDNRPAIVAVQQVPSRLAPLALPIVPPPPAHVAAAAPALPEALAYSPPSVPPSAAAAAIPAVTLPISPAPLTASAPALPNAHLILGASADSWVQVKDATGKVLLSRLMHQGENWPVPAGATPLVLTTGNAGGTLLIVDGKPTPVLGAPGAVLHDVALDPATLPHA